MTIKQRDIDALLEQCAREPIQFPGSIQPHGCLLGIDSRAGRIIVASANTAEFFGAAPDELLGADFDDCLPGVSLPAQMPTPENLLFANPLQLRLPTANGNHLVDVVAHEADGVWFAEFENCFPESSVELASRSAVDPYLNLVNRITLKIRSCVNVADVAEIFASEFRAFSGFDRVMVYKFMADFSGEVIAESRDNEVESFLGLRFPESDIPSQARRLYTLNHVRQIVDSSFDPVPLTPALHPSTGAPWNLSNSVLRSVSPVHCQYLANMNVRGSFSISIVCEGRLWGLVACHHRTPKFVPYKLRAIAELLASIVSGQIQQVSQKHLLMRKFEDSEILHEVLRQLAKSSFTADGVVAAVAPLLALFDACGMAVHVDDAFRLVGKTPADETASAILNSKTLAAEPVVATNDTARLVPEICSDEQFAAGVLRISLSEDSQNAVVFFRPRITETVRWAGNPNAREKASGADAPHLSPRRSFAEWRETVKGQSAEWESHTLDIARDLAAALQLLVIQPSRKIQDLNLELVKRNDELTQFAHSVAHDLKAPLITVLGWSGIVADALERGNSSEAGEAVSRVVKAGEKMDRTISHVLKLSRDGRELEVRARVALGELVEQVREALDGQIKAASASLEVVSDLGVVHGDADRLYAVVENLFTNALKYAGGRIEIGRVDADQRGRIFIRDFGPGIPQDQLERIFDLFARNSNKSEGDGVGLALVRKIMKAHGGSAWAESVVGQGSTFWLEFPQ